MSALAETIRAAAVEIGDQFTFDCAAPNGNAHRIEWVEDKLHEHLAVIDQWEAIRQTVNCPTCGGNDSSPSSWAKTAAAIADGSDEALRRRMEELEQPCPDCTDGKIDMARLLAVGAAVFAASVVDLPDRLPRYNKTIFGFNHGVDSTLRLLRQVRP